ncbi:hypothetical protein ACLQ2Q_01620 [Microbacterium sp. DT81.1]|uniref:hypothetical protein n=1 Tax=Microbacterium sp. DT81.1 TaxID=3393413 RepID=UPI003CF5C2A1
MEPRIEHPLAVFRRREQDVGLINERRLRRSLAQGTHVRVVAGSYADRRHWDRLSPMNRHFVRTLETADRLRGAAVFCHYAAAAIWGIDILGRWPAVIDVRIPRGSGGRSSGAVRRRALGFDGVDVVPWGAHLVTTPAQTVIDLARELTFTAGVAAMDRASWGRREGGPLTTSAEILESLERQSGARGMIRARRAAAFATHLSDSVRESQSRVAIDRLGFPTPELQRRIRLPSGRSVYPDFFFEEFDHAGEFDGKGKYFDPDILQGRSPQQALLEEKDREDELRRAVRALSRWRTPALQDPRMLYDILTADGLPSRRPRPRVGLRWD